MSEATPLIRVKDLSVHARGSVLLDKVGFELHHGERVLLVGPSGSGKSLLSNLLLGFVGPDTAGLEIEGHLEIDGSSLLGKDPQARDGHVGAVFQLHALGLFDDLTIDQNLRFGRDDPQAIEAVMEQLGLTGGKRRIPEASGGERMRVAIARTLLRGGRILLYDEPTTGLDPAASRQVVDAIRASHRDLTLIVTHDYAAFEGEADTILLIDRATGGLERHEASAEGFAAVHAAMTGAAAQEAPPRAPGQGPIKRLGRLVGRFFVGTAEVIEDAVVALLFPLSLLQVFARRDGPRIRQILRRDVSPRTAAFIGIGAILTAFTGTWFLFERLPEAQYAEPLIREDLLAGLGLIASRVGVPLLVSVLLAAKLGAAAAAHLGHMTYTRQVDALALLRVSARRHLLLPTALGQVLAALAALAVAEVLAYTTSLLVFLGTHAGFSVAYFHRSYLQEVDTGDVGWVLVKVAASAVAVALTAFRVGLSPKPGPGDVVKGIHRTLLRALLYVLAIHAAVAFVEF